MASPSLAARAAILGMPYDPNKKPDRLATVKAFELMDAKAMATSAGAIVRDTLADLGSVTNPPAHQMAWVTGDATAANNGIYENAGSPSVSNWLRRADLPYGLIHMINAGEGTADAIVATSALPLPVAPGVALLTVNILAANTGNVTLNGKPLRTNSGNEIAPGGLTAGSIHAFLDLGSEYRLLSDQASAAVLSGAEAAKLAAEAAAAAISTAPQWAFSTKTAAGLFDPDTPPDFISLTGSVEENGIGRTELFEVLPSATPDPTDLPAAAYVRLTDGSLARWRGREFPLELGAKGDGITDNTSFFDDFSAAMADFGGVITADRGVFKTTKPLQMPKGFHLQGAGADKTIFDFTGVSSMAGAGGLMHRSQTSYLTALPDLAADITSRTQFELDDASGIEDGDWLCLYNPTDGSWISSRPTYRAGEWVKVSRKNGNLIIPTEPLWHLYDAADMDVYLHRGPQIIARDFGIVGPFMETACFFIDTSINPIIENVRTFGTHYAGIALQRVLEPYVNCNLTQRWDTGSVGNEYALILSIVHGGEIHGDYHSQRHGIAQGNVDTICCVPNRKTRFYANTSSPDGAGSLDFGHGCSEGLEAIGGRHTGIVLGGARHKIIGGTSDAAEGRGNDTTAGLVMSGSEFRGGDFEISGISFRSLGHATATGVAPIQLTLGASCVEPARFIFSDCLFLNEAANAYYLRIYKNNCPTEPSLIIKDPVIDDVAGSLSYFARLTLTAGDANFKMVEMTGVSGMADNVRRLSADASVTATKWKFDPQVGTYTATGDTGVSQLSPAVSFPYAYPTGAVPHVTASAKSAMIGGKRCVVATTGQSVSSVALNIATADGANFANTNTGAVGWRAEFV